MTLRIPLLLALSCALAACASVEDVRKREPVFFGSTARSAQDYVTCVANAWQGLGSASRRQDVRNGYELIVEGGAGVEAVLTAATWQNKTDVTLSTRIPRRNQNLIEAANLCR